jgi:tetratricopeptide (TPR) repeat protein
MAVDPGTALTALKSVASAAVKPTVGFFRLQYSRRGAEFADIAAASGAEPELAEAIAVLSGTAETLPSALVAKLKGFASARPGTFDDPNARRFVQDDRVASLIKSGARKLLRNDNLDAEHQAAREIYTELFDEEGAFGETLIDDGIAFATMTLLAHLTPGDRQTLEVVIAFRGEMSERFDQLSDQIAAKDAAGKIEAAPFDAVIRAETRRLRQQRMLDNPAYPERALALGTRVEAGLHLADPQVRADAFREVAIVLSRVERIPEAERWIEKAEVLGADVVCERARIAMAAADWDGALRTLRGRADPASRSLLVDCLAGRDGDEEALAYYEAEFTPSDLTGHALQNLAARMINAGRYDDAFHLFEQASPDQIDENPVLLYLRGRHRISRAVAPDLAKRILEYDGLIPWPHDLHGDAAGLRQLEQALSDFKQLQPLLPALEADDFSSLVDMNVTFLSLSVGDEVERAQAQSALLAQLEIPAKAAQLVPLATMFGIEADWTSLKAALKEAEKLGGFDDTQLRAAFALAMEGGDPQALAAFVRRYRERIQPFLSTGSAVALEIEALAMSGQMAAAKELLEAEREALEPKVQAFLIATLTELEGSDAVPMRLEQFEESGSTHDLVILVEAMRRARDSRLGEHLIELWRRRRQVQDAQHALDTLIQAGDESRAEEFLEELGDEARNDPGLQIHLAWARFRQGRLDDAESELKAIKAGGVDDVNTRHLAVMLAIETGRWAELEPLVQHQLAVVGDRSASELIGSAKIARTMGSAVTLDLLRAAVALKADDTATHLAAYTIATEAGLDHHSEVGSWLAAALANSDGSKLIQKTGLEEVLEIMRANRANADRVGGLVNAAEVPLFVALAELGGTQSELVIRQMTSNSAVTDSRRRTVVPLFAGNRALRADFQPSSISLDPLAILVLDYLGLLATTIDAFDVVLPAGTLHSFFEDLGKAAHSQPSRVAQARKHKESATSGVINVEAFEVGEDNGPVDNEFAALFAAAEARDGYLIDTAPLYPPQNLSVEVDLAPYSKRLISPVGLIEALKTAGVISQATAKEARLRIAGSGEAFPDEPELQPDKPLFLTSLALQYLSDANILGTAKAHSGTLIVSSRTIEIADAEIAQGAAAEPIRKSIESIKAVLADAIAGKRVRIGPARQAKGDKARNGNMRPEFSPVMNVMRDAAGVEAFVCDDRAMNKYDQSTDQKGHSLTFLTTADLLVMMRKLGKIDDDDLSAAREKLRKGGAGLMPLEPTELADAVRNSNWKIGPNAELRAIRDSVHLPFARRMLQLPNERPWLRMVSLSIAFAIRTAWQQIADDEDAEGAANWLLDLLPDPVGWTAGDVSPDAPTWITDVSRHSLWAIASIFDMPPSRVERYRLWFAARVEPRFAVVDPGALEAVARTLYKFLSAPIEDTDNGEH